MQWVRFVWKWFFPPMSSRPYHCEEFLVKPERKIGFYLFHLSFIFVKSVLQKLGNIVMESFFNE
jgi:hypothetical protein